MSSEVSQLVATIKRELKAQGFKYRDLAKAMQISEASIKRIFADESFSVSRLAEVGRFLGYTLAELLQLAANDLPQLDCLTTEQEQQLVSDDTLLLVAVCAINHWSLDEILQVYDIAKSAAIRRLRILDRMGVIELLPGDRIRRRTRRDFAWIQDGPIRRYFLKHGVGDFIAGPFEPSDESFEFAHGMLTPAAQAEIKLELRRLRAKLASLHDQSVAVPVADKSGVGLLLGLRRWEPVAFRTMRRS